MGNKVHPTSFRLGKLKNWTSLWYNPSQEDLYLHEDILIKEFIKNFFFSRNISISNIYIDRSNEKEIKIFLNLILVSGFIGTKIPFKKFKRKFFKWNRKYKLKFLHYRKLNKFIKFKKNISNNFNVFDRINLFLYKNKIHFSPLYKNKQVFATKELIIKKKPVCYKKKPFLVYKKLNILFVKNTFIYKFIIFNLKKINLLDLNIIYKIHNFFHDIRETKKVFLSFTQVNKIHFRIASKSIKIKNIINFIILNTIKKDTIYLDLTHFFFYIKNFNVLKITKDNYITNIELFFNNTVNFNLKFNRFSYSFVLPSKGIIGRSNFNAIRPFLFLTGFKNKKNKKFALKNKINTFFKFYVHNFNSRKINAMYFKKKVGLSRRRGRINFFFPIKYSLQEIIKRKKIVFIQKQRIFKVKKPFIKKPFKKTIII